MKSGLRYFIVLITVIFSAGCDTDSTPGYPFVAPPEGAVEPGSKLGIVMLYVAHGNSTLMVMPTGKMVLVDSGLGWAARKYVLPFLDRHGITKIDYYIITHYHSDHIGAKKEIIQTYQPDTIWDNKSFFDGQEFDFEGTRMTILNACKKGARATNDPNRNSLSFLVEYNGFVYCDGGDIYSDEQKTIMRQFDIRAHIYNTSHHMDGPISLSYLITTDPFLFFTSAGSDVYKSKAYRVDLQSAVDYLFENNGRLIASLVSEEVGHLVVQASNGSDWRYYTIPDVEYGMAPHLFDL